MAPNVVELILKKRDGKELTEDEIIWFVEQFTAGAIPDYQCASFLMAVCLKDMTDRETAALTQAMVRSGTVADLSAIRGPKVDKHSTGGVGDKTSLILAPIVASLGPVVPMMSGRGLGHTGGTLDKLESLPGFTCDLGEAGFKRVLADVGVAIVSTSSSMCPADRKMYALRDVTATVRGVPLQTASIMCKKLAENPDSLVLDVKTGLGAFNQDEAESIRLAQSMIAAGERDGKETSAFVTAMDQPLGNAIGNWLEVAEAIRTLRGEGPPDLEDLSVHLAGQMLVQSLGAAGGCATLADAVAAARQQLRNGEAHAAFRRMAVAQGADAASIDDLAASPHGPERGASGSNGGRLVILQGVYGAADAAPAPVAALAASPAAAKPNVPHAPFWGAPVHGLEACRSLDTFLSAPNAAAMRRRPPTPRRPMRRRSAARRARSSRARSGRTARPSRAWPASTRCRSARRASRSAAGGRSSARS